MHNPIAWTLVAKVNTQWIIANTSLPHRPIGFPKSRCLQIFLKRLGKIFVIYISFGSKGKFCASHPHNSNKGRGNSLKPEAESSPKPSIAWNYYCFIISRMKLFVYHFQMSFNCGIIINKSLCLSRSLNYWIAAVFQFLSRVLKMLFKHLSTLAGSAAHLLSQSQEKAIFSWRHSQSHLIVFLC